MIDETKEIRKMYRERSTNPEVYENTLFYGFDDIGDIRTGLNDLKRSFTFQEDEKYKKILARCIHMTHVELLFPDRKIFLLKDSSSVIGATSHLDNVKRILEQTSLIHGYVFGEVYYKDKGYALFEGLETLLLYAIFTEFDPSHVSITPDSPSVENPRSPSSNDPYCLLSSKI